MRKMWRTLIGIMVLAFMLCLTMLVMSGTAFAQRFVDNGDGTVTDTQDDLMWARNANAIGKLHWDAAVTRCGNLNIAGQADWRLPNIKELESLSKAIQAGGTPFSGDFKANYWSNNTRGKDYAYYIYMSEGHINYYIKTAHHYAWPVRNVK